MNESIISVRYTKAIFLLAKEKGLLDVVNNDMEIIFSFMNESNELQHVFKSPVLKPSKKQEIIEKVFHSFNKMTISFINLLIKNRRESHLFDISRNFLTWYKKHNGIETATFTTAVSMESLTYEKVRDLIKTVLKTEVDLTNRIDQNIIGGFIIRVGDRQIDSSVKSNLNKAKKKLLNASISAN
jgi:F-type H+-transporting ATPase subunit delta